VRNNHEAYISGVMRTPSSSATAPSSTACAAGVVSCQQGLASTRARGPVSASAHTTATKDPVRFMRTPRGYALVGVDGGENPPAEAAQRRMSPPDPLPYHAAHTGRRASAGSPAPTAGPCASFQAPCEPYSRARPRFLLKIVYP
jgi:hypothetical protein